MISIQVNYSEKNQILDFFEKNINQSFKRIIRNFSKRYLSRAMDQNDQTLLGYHA